MGDTLQPKLFTCKRHLQYSNPDGKNNRPAIRRRKYSKTPFSGQTPLPIYSMRLLALNVELCLIKDFTWGLNGWLGVRAELPFKPSALSSHLTPPTPSPSPSPSPSSFPSSLSANCEHFHKIQISTTSLGGRRQIWRGLYFAGNVYIGILVFKGTASRAGLGL